MKITIEIPEPLFREVTCRAAERGQTLGEFVADALQTRLAPVAEGGQSDGPKWMAGFGNLRRLRKETARIQRVADVAFEAIEAEDRL